MMNLLNRLIFKFEGSLQFVPWPFFHYPDSKSGAMVVLLSILSFMTAQLLYHDDNILLIAHLCDFDMC